MGMCGWVCVFLCSSVEKINTDNTFHFSGATVQLESESLEVNEGDGSVDVCVVLSGNEDCPVQFPFNFSFHANSSSGICASRSL